MAVSTLFTTCYGSTRGAAQQEHGWEGYFERKLALKNARKKEDKRKRIIFFFNFVVWRAPSVYPQARSTAKPHLCSLFPRNFGQSVFSVQTSRDSDPAASFYRLGGVFLELAVGRREA